MKIHEYQAKALLARHGVPVPEGWVADRPETAVGAGRALGSWPLAVKAQIHAGGRGKGGGVRLAATPQELEAAARAILGMRLVTPQTGPEGQMVRQVLIEKGAVVCQEFYLALVADRRTSRILVIASQAGGMDIEETARRTPEQVLRLSVSPMAGPRPFQIRQLAFGLGLGPKGIKGLDPILRGLYSLMISADCLLVEINPLVLREDGALIALDAKVELDDNALFRHPDLATLRDPTEEDPLEAEAARHNLNYIRLSGTIGNMVNGAGLAMATMDLIKRAGAEPANFLDVGGGASAEMVENGFRIILRDRNVRGIFVNIFGGILRCDLLARGIVEAARKEAVSVPVVVRMEGTNVDEGRRILAESGLSLVTATNLADAAAKIAAIAQAGVPA